MTDEAGGGPGAARLGEGLRQHPHRGDVIAAGAVLLAIGVAMVDVRMGGAWNPFWLFMIDALACALVLGLGLRAPPEDLEDPAGEPADEGGAAPERGPPRYQTAMLVAGLGLALLALMRLAQVMGVDEPALSAGALSWTMAALGLLALHAARRTRSPACTLIAALAGGVSLLAFVELSTRPDTVSPFRWILAALILAYGAGALALHDRRRAHSAQLINAAGIALILLGLLLEDTRLDLFADPDAGAPAGWEIALLTGGLGLTGYAGIERRPAPGVLGLVVLVIFVAVAGQPVTGGADLGGWPLILLAVGAAVLAVGLRPRGDLAPESRPPRRREPPAAVRAEPEPRPVEAAPPPAATGVNRRLFLDDDFLAAESARRRRSASTAGAGVSAPEPPEPGEETPAVPPVTGDAEGESPAPAEAGPRATASREEAAAPRGDEAAPPGEEIAPRGGEIAPRGHSAETLVDLVRGEPRDPAPDAQPMLEEPDPTPGLEAPGPVGGADPDPRGEPRSGAYAEDGPEAGGGTDAEDGPEPGGGADPRPGPERGEPRPPGAGKAPGAGEEGSEAATDPTRP